jgi:hypothetical protein
VYLKRVRNYLRNYLQQLLTPAVDYIFHGQNEGEERHDFGH